ncbi:MAG TPA: nitrilase-related carbon-nitrogen hydrolase [Pirellulales bacterium]|nr:nitrilase-related carbon-nitrogen hydrolase [Pirellulales bacterium]
MHIIACQLDIHWEDKEANFAAVRAMLGSAAPAEPTLIVLPEMFAVGFSMQVDRTAEPVGGDTDQFVAALAREHKAYVMAGVVGRAADGRGRNEALIVDPRGQEIARYVKLNPFSLGGETKHYARGEDVQVVDVAAWRLAPFVCYDLRFPEIFRRAAQRGANLMVCIANWPVARIGHWTTLLAARAVENQCYVVGLNRTGRDPHLEYNGRSAIFDPHGRAIAALEDRPGLLSARLDLAELEKYRGEYPFLGDLRPEFLRPL